MQASKASKGKGSFGPPKCVFPLTGPARETKLLQLPPFLADLFPNTVLSGVLQGLYIPSSCTPSQAVPRAPGLLGSQAPTQHPGPQW